MRETSGLGATDLHGQGVHENRDAVVSCPAFREPLQHGIQFFAVKARHDVELNLDLGASPPRLRVG